MLYKQGLPNRGPMAASGGAFKDVALALVIVGAVLGGLFVFTGVWPPMVVVESGSMMHGVDCPPPAGLPEVCDPQVGYGKLGTIDPGDMVFVKRAPSRPEIVTLGEAAAKEPGQRNYGKPGDVVVYFNFENVPQDPAARAEAKKLRTPIIHRAVAYVEVNGVADREACLQGRAQAASYSVFWEGRTQTFDNRGVFLPPLFAEPQFSRDNGYKPCWSGFITKGDNPLTNTLPDQALGGPTLPRMPVELEWVEGKAIGELPWFGLIKLALSGTLNYPQPCHGPQGQQYWRPHEPSCDNGRAIRVHNAYAPPDLWVMLGVSLAFIAIAPLGYDFYLLQRQKGRLAAEARGEPPPPSLLDELKAKLDELLGRGRAEPPPAAEEGGVDPRKAFEPGAPAAPPGGDTAPPPPPPAGKPGAKFERVTKK